jgi:hypothetical protein
MGPTKLRQPWRLSKSRMSTLRAESIFRLFGPFHKRTLCESRAKSAERGNLWLPSGCQRHSAAR